MTDLHEIHCGSESDAAQDLGIGLKAIVSLFYLHFFAFSVDFVPL